MLNSKTFTKIFKLFLLLSFYNLFSNPYLLERKNYKKYYLPHLEAYFYLDDIPDQIKTHLKKGIYWESTIGDLIRKHIRKGSIAIDVGAHIGIHTIRMSRRVGSQGMVVSFEPQKKIHAELVQNLKLNNRHNVATIQKALGETFKTVHMDICNVKNEGGTAIGQGGDTVKMIPLDSLHLNDVSLIKVDIERYEYWFFQGAKETILRNKPVLIFEVMGECDYNHCTPKIKKQFDQVFDLVESFGYRIELINGNDYIAFPL